MCQVSPKPDSLVNALLEDLEQQALGLHLLARDQELAEREQAEYAQVSLRGRWHGAVGAQVQVGLSTGQRLRGTVQRTGADWVSDDGEELESWPGAVVAGSDFTASLRSLLVKTGRAHYPPALRRKGPCLNTGHSTMPNF